MKIFLEWKPNRSCTTMYMDEMDEFISPSLVLDWLII